MGTCSLIVCKMPVSWVLLGDIQIQEVWAGAQESVVPVAPQGNLDGPAGLGATTAGILVGEWDPVSWGLVFFPLCITIIPSSRFWALSLDPAHCY